MNTFGASIRIERLRSVISRLSTSELNASSVRLGFVLEHSRAITAQQKPFAKCSGLRQRADSRRLWPRYCRLPWAPTGEHPILPRPELAAEWNSTRVERDLSHRAG